MPKQRITPDEKASVQVAVRIRPKNSKESDSTSIVIPNANSINIFDDSNAKKTFNYDYVYSEDSIQEDLYRDIGSSVIDSAYKGYNTCVFAYGQTGCFAQGTKIKMYDSTIKKVEDISVGDIVLGDDCTKRNVLKLFSGKQLMYRISDESCVLPSYEVNQDHIMVIMVENKLVEVPITELSTNKKHIGYYYDIQSEELLTYNILITPLEINRYYGFMLDGNHRFQHESGIILRNSGKSHSVMGSDDKPGLIPRVCQALFDEQKTRNVPGATYKLELSYLEIYSEDVRDLLSKKSGILKVREHPTFGPYVEHLQQILVDDYKTIKKLIDQGNKERATASTLMNSRSSRSHAILTLYFTQIIDEYKTGKPREIISKINLVDLAGSERVESSGVTGINFKEAININKSLTSLGIVISKLAANTGKSEEVKKISSPRPTMKSNKRSSIVGTKPSGEHVPYRDSTLTWILKESLGGNSKTIMIATVSPSSLYYSETLDTLRYAANAKKIVNMVKINENSSDRMIRMLQDEIKNLQLQLSTKGSDASTSPEELRALREELAQREELMREKDKTWEQKMLESKKISDQVQENMRNELVQKQQEFQQKMAMMNEERVAMLKEMEAIKSDVSDKDIQQQKELEEEFQRKQAEFEKDRIVNTALTLQEHYDKKLDKIKEEYDQKIKERETLETNKINSDIQELKSINIKLRDELNQTQKSLKEQMKKYNSERTMLSKHVQQLQLKITLLEKEPPKTITIEDTTNLNNEYANLLKLKTETENKYKELKNQYESLIITVNSNKSSLEEIETKYNFIIKDIDSKQLEYAQLKNDIEKNKLEYAALITAKDLLQKEVSSLRFDLDSQVAIAKDKLKNPTIEDLIKIKDGFVKIFSAISKSSET